MKGEIAVRYTFDRSAVPIAAKFAFADVQQPEGFPRSGRVADIKALGTHR